VAETTHAEAAGSAPASHVRAGMAFLITRVDVAQQLEPWERWQIEKHMPDLVAAPGVCAAVLHELVASTGGTATQGTPNRAVSYLAPSLDAMREWLASDELAEAISEGSRWSSITAPLDGAWFTGNVYQAFEIAGAGGEGGSVDLAGSLVVARWELPEQAPANDDWLRECLLASARCVGVRAGAAARAIRGPGVPELYWSAGRSAIVLEVEDTFDGSDLVRLSEALADASADAHPVYASLELVRPLALTETGQGDRK
jgi:hypothetical protein